MTADEAVQWMHMNRRDDDIRVARRAYLSRVGQPDMAHAAEADPEGVVVFVEALADMVEELAE
jgi:hypothetical protein